MRARIETESVSVSPIVGLELTYLFEVGKLTEPASAPLAFLRRTIGLQVADASLAEVTRAAADLTWTRNPFDRLIAAHSIVAGAPLVTADRALRENLPNAIWD